MELAIEDYTGAIDTTIKQLGGYKVVGAQLRPEMDAVAAGRWLADCCNADRPAVLHPQQLAYIRRLARQAGVHTLIEYEAQDAGYARPVPAAPRDERAELQREFVRAVEQQQQLVARMAQLLESD